MEQLPQDINMLLSFVNMKLRDDYDSLDEMCDSMDIDKEELIAKLAEGGFEYNESQKKFW
ncbi:MAG: DUF4250 domain-containing protein [Paludibacteraceae bacterium]|nr:DUF4250 domain-containing protein [Paludibacteraceae bacterium]